MSNLKSPSVLEVCDHVKHLGYATSGRIRLYGEEFEVVSDPFPENDGIAVRVKSKGNSTIRVLAAGDGGSELEIPKPESRLIPSCGSSYLFSWDGW